MPLPPPGSAKENFILCTCVGCSFSWSIGKFSGNFSVCDACTPRMTERVKYRRCSQDVVLTDAVWHHKQMNQMEILQS